MQDNHYDVDVDQDPGVSPHSGKLDRLLTAGARVLGLCGWGPDFSWSIRTANAFIPDDGCACCAVWRALFAGCAAGVITTAALAAVLRGLGL